MNEITNEYPKQKSPIEKALQIASKGKLGNDPTPDENGKVELTDEMYDSKGCTAVVMMIVGKDIYVSNAGDSRAVMAQAGKAIDLSTDHKPALDYEKERILKAGSTITPEGRIDGNLNLSRAIGDLRYKKKDLKPEEHPVTSFPEITKTPLTEDVDFVVMGCDGIWETKTS